jgi:predicted MPP superfamily phosphohydrolase
MSFALRIALAFLIIFVLEFYFIRKIIGGITVFFPKANPKKIKRAIVVLLIYINIYPFYLLFAWLLSTQRVSLPDSGLFHYFIIYPFWISILTIIQSILILLPIDLLRITLFPVYKKYKNTVTNYSRKFTFILTVFFILYVPGRIIYDYQSVSVRIKELGVTNLPEDLEGLKITFISDLQADRYTDENRLGNYIEKVNSTNPDLVLVAGDFITSTPTYINQAAKLAGNIKAKYGVYSCVGDHDHWSYREDTKRSVREMAEALAKYNIKMIDNDKTNLQVGNSVVRLTFVTNTYANRLTGNALDSLLNSNGYDFKILIVHQPGNSVIEKAKTYNYNLFLAGHTHGGQVTFLFPFVQISPTMFETKYIRGDFYFDDMLMVINRGLGMSLVPFRYNSTPEVTVIVLNNK